MAIITKPNIFQAGQVADASAVNANFDTIYNDHNGNLTDANIANTGITTYGKVSGSSLATLGNINSGAGTIPIANIPLASIYPVGIVITLGVSTNPATLFGFGTWTAIAGKVIVGINAGDTEFDTLNETGGAKTHTHGAGSFNLPDSVYSNGTQNTENHLTCANAGVLLNKPTSTMSISGTSDSGSSLQPYIVKYVWERTA